MSRLGADVVRALSEALGAPVERAEPVSGGDINRAHRVWLRGGGSAFVKTHPQPPPDFYASEAWGLAWLDTGALRVPRVLAAQARFLALEWIDCGSPGPGAQAELGRGLARLHREGAPGFGLERGSYLGTLAQDNRSEPDWPRFYGRRRLLPLLERAAARTPVGAATVRAVERIADELPQRAGPAEPPARLHGDLWSGNALYDAKGAPVLVDPAVYAGHREVDLAMMRLFGGFGEAVFDAYRDAYPLAPGFERRVPLYQLLPLLAHVALFGASYLGALERTIAALD